MSWHNRHAPDSNADFLLSRILLLSKNGGIDASLGYNRTAVLTAAVLVGDTAVERSVAAQSSRGGSLTAVPGAVGFLDPTGPYEVVAGWPKDLSTTPGNERWTFGAGQGVFAESPDRVYYIQRGSLPIIPPQGRRGGTPAPQMAPNLSFPVANLWRNATNASPPGALFKPVTERPATTPTAARTVSTFSGRTASS